MNLRVEKKIGRKLDVFAYYQIAGGVVGLILTAILIAQTANVTGLALLIFVLATSLYIFSIYCGRLLFRKAYDIGLKLSILNQALQMFSFALFGFAFKYVAGLFLGMEIDYTDDFKFDFKFSLAAFQVNINTDKDSIALGVNFLAVYVIQSLMKIQEEIGDKKLFQKPQTEAEVLETAQDKSDNETS